MKELSPKDIFEIAGRSEAEEVHIDLAKKTITIDNRSDLYKILHSFDLVTFTENGNGVIILDRDGVPTLASVSKKVKFKNSFESDSPNFTHPLTATVGDKDEWTILGVVGKSLPEAQKH